MLLSEFGQLAQLVGRMLFCPDNLLEVERDLKLDLFPRSIALMYHFLSSSGRGMSGVMSAMH